MQRPFLRLLSLLVVVSASVVDAAPPALVIANWKYDEKLELNPLQTPEQDARVMKETLEGLEQPFAVALHTNLGKSELRRVVTDFIARHQNEPVMLIYFSGHGIQVKNANYLLATDSDLRLVDKVEGLRRAFSGATLEAVVDTLKEETARKEALALNDVLALLPEADPDRLPLRLLILDACRINPFVDDQAAAKSLFLAKSAGGLARVDEKPGLFVGFAASANQEAQQNDDRRFQGSNIPPSLFTEHLAARLRQGGPLDQIFNQAAADVFKVSSQLRKEGIFKTTQTPARYALAYRPFTFVPKGAGASAAMVPGGLVVVPTQVAADPFAGTEAGQSRENSLGSAFRWCPPGEFWMGSSEADKKAFARDGITTDDETQHQVRLSKGFWLSEKEVTQGEWASIMGRSLKDQARLMLQDDTLFDLGGKKQTLRDFKGKARDADPGTQIGVESPSVPVYYVNWEEAMEYCRRLTEREQKSGRLPQGWRYTLPTEAQWEYACRAGTETTLYNGGLVIKDIANAPALDGIAWYGGNSSEGYVGQGWDTKGWSGKKHPGGFAGPRRVGQKQPNSWGLHDMIGNVWEWCADWYAADISTTTKDSAGPTTGVYRVYRGGSWCDFAAACRAASRSSDEAGMRDDNMGFRPALFPTR